MDLPNIPDDVMERALDATEADELLGICLACKTDQGGVEPDAERYVCEECGEPAVYGCEQIVLMGYNEE